MIWVIAITGIVFLGGIAVGVLQGVQRIYSDASRLLSDEMRQDILTGYLQLWFFSVFMKIMETPLNDVQRIAVGSGLAFVHCLLIRKIRAQQNKLAGETGQWTDYINKAGMLGAVSVGLLGWGLSVMMVHQHFDPNKDLNTLDYVFGVTLLSYGIGGLSGVMVIRTLWAALIDHQKKRIRLCVYGSIIGALAGGWISIIARPHPAVMIYVVYVVIGGVISGLLTGGWLISVRPLTAVLTTIGNRVAELVALILSEVHFSTIICGHCYRYTEPRRSLYDRGRRYCEHCQTELPFTHDPGTVIFLFGHISPPLPDSRMFMLSNPDFEQKDKPIDVCEVYIDTTTVDKRLLERFVTNILNCPPKHGLQSVQIFYQGKLDELGGNLKNALQNNFECVERITI